MESSSKPIKSAQNLDIVKRLIKTLEGLSWSFYFSEHVPQNLNSS